MKSRGFQNCQFPYSSVNWEKFRITKNWEKCVSFWEKKRILKPLRILHIPRKKVSPFDVLPKQRTCEMKALQVQVFIQQWFHDGQGTKFM